MDVRKAGTPLGVGTVRLRYRVDNGSDHTTFPLVAAGQLGLVPDEIRRDGIRIGISGVTGGQTVSAYLYDVRLRVEDEFGGWAEWTGAVAFYEGMLRREYAGCVGFLEHLLLADRGLFYYLDPVGGFRDPPLDGDFHCTVDTTALVT